MPEPQHFTDYGFDPQMDYLQVLEEARKHKRETSRSVDALHYKLQKPIYKEDLKKSKKKKKKWWSNALLFWRWKWAHGDRPNGEEYGSFSKRNRVCRGSISGPVYITESRSGSTTPYRTTSRPVSGPVAGSFTPTAKGEIEIPYLCLRDLNMDMEPQKHHRISTSAVPIYLVT